MQHTPAVQRRGRQQVERGQEQVDVAEPGGDPVDLGRRAGQRDQHEENAQHDRDERPRDGNAELGAGALEPTLELRDASEQPERDRVDLDPFSARHPGVPELVQSNRSQEEQSRDDGHPDVRRVREAWVRVREDAFCQRPDDQGDDREQAPVEPKLDAAETPDSEVSVHPLVPALGHGLAGAHGDLLASVEEREQEQEDVENVEEDRGGEQRRSANVLRPPQALEVVQREPGEDHQARDRVDQRGIRNPHEDRDDPEDDQREERPEADAGDPREVAARRVTGRAEAGDEERGRAARLPHRLRVRRGVVRDRGGGPDPHQDAESEQHPDRELLRPGDGEVEAEQEAEARDVRDEAPAVGQVAPEVCAKGEEARRDRDEPHRLREQRARLISGENGSSDGLVRAHSTTTRNGFPFSTTYVASSAALPVPTFLTAWTVSAGTIRAPPASNVFGGSPSIWYSSDPSST